MNKIERLTVYLGSSGRCRDVFKDEAALMGQMIGKNNKSLVYGGMDSGLMGIVANHALEHGAKVTGIIPKSLKDSERIHPKLTETILVNDLWERKRKMFKRADAIIVLAGGFGTIDEALEALYWADLGSHAKPVIFVNTENYWDEFLAYIKTLPDLRREYILTVSNSTEIFRVLENWTPPRVTGDSENLPHFEDIILQDTTEQMIFTDATIKDSYILATALGLKQLGKHNRPLGILNDKEQFDTLLRWIETAQAEHFITDRCTNLFDVQNDPDSLKKKLNAQQQVKIDLHTEKWGPSETPTHIVLTEKR